MKKFAAIVLCVLSVAMLAGCGKEEVPFTARSFESEAHSVTVKARDREIKVEKSEDELVHIDYLDSEKEFFDITVENDSLVMLAKTDKEAKDYIGQNAPKELRVITLYLPEALLESLTISTTNENILLPDLTVGEVTLTANGGDITFDTLSAGSALTLDVKNGDISGKVLGGWDDFDITCTIKKGDTNLPEQKEGGEKTLSVTANNGDVNLEFVK